MIIHTPRGWSGARGAVSPATRGIAVQSLVKRNNRSQGGVTPFPVTCRAARVHVQRVAFMMTSRVVLEIRGATRYCASYGEMHGSKTWPSHCEWSSSLPRMWGWRLPKLWLQRIRQLWLFLVLFAILYPVDKQREQWWAEQRRWAW